jgi:hypothetical protein
VWSDPVASSYLDYIDKLGGIYYRRWGDAPIRTVAVSLTVPEGKLHYFSDIGYEHRPFQVQAPQPLPAPGVLAFEHLELAAEYEKALEDEAQLRRRHVEVSGGKVGAAGGLRGGTWWLISSRVFQK